MDLGDLEQLAIETYRRHGLDPDEPIRTVKLARLVLDDADGVVRAPLTVSGPAVRFTHNDRQKIGIRRGLPLEYALFYVGHELAHIVLEREGFAVDAETEIRCDYLSACFTITRPAAHRLHRVHGFDLAKGAAQLRTTETGWALRIGEVEGVPLAAISPRNLRVRGPEEWTWPDERTLRSWAKTPRPGVRKVPITDGRGRVALVASGEE